VNENGRNDMSERAKFQTIPKKNLIVIFIAVVVYALLVAVLAFVIAKAGYVSSQMSKQSLTVWKIVGILLSLYTLTTPWRRQKKIISRANQPNLTVRQIWGVLILFGFIPFIAPLIYGLVLLFWGLSFLEFCYFVAISVVGALTWLLYNLRKNF
jgi:hypothetical protein